MTHDATGIRLRTLAFVGILILAFGVRLSHLGALPLTDPEAQEALWAAEGTSEDSAFWPVEDSSSSSGAYQAVTWLAFQVAGGSDAAARVFPAVIGSLIVLPPWLLRRRLGSLAALIASFLLAVSPTLTATARMADGASLAMVAAAIGATAFILGLDGEWDRGRAASLIAACVALGLSAGPTFYAGLLSLTAAAGLMLLTAPRAWTASQWANLKGRLPAALGMGILGAVLLSFAFGWLPRGGTALAEGLRVWLLGWLGAGQMHALTPLAILVAYEPLLLVFGIVGAIAAVRTRDSLGIGATWWAAIALLIAVVYSGRSAPAVAWCAIPLAMLSGQSLAREAERIARLPSPWHAVGVAALITLMLLYAGVQLSAYISGIGPGANPLMPEARLAVAAGAVIVAILAVILIGLGWSWDIARSGVAGAGALVLLFLTLSSGWRLNFYRDRLGASELWSTSAPTYGIPRLASTIASLSISSTGVSDALTIVIDDRRPPPSLIWALRSFAPPKATADSALAESPPVILTRADSTQPALSADYLGQTVAIGEQWGFSGAVPPDPLRWWWRRRLPAIEDSWRLLVRADVATLGESGSGEGEP